MFIDIHDHAYHRHPVSLKDGKQWFSTPEQLPNRSDKRGIEKGVLLPLVNPEVYLPQSNEEILEIAKKYIKTSLFHFAISTLGL